MDEYLIRKSFILLIGTLVKDHIFIRRCNLVLSTILGLERNNKLFQM